LTWGHPVHVILYHCAANPASSSKWLGGAFQPPSSPLDQVDSLPRPAHDLSSRSIYHFSKFWCLSLSETPFQILYRPRASRIHSAFLVPLVAASYSRTLAIGRNSTRQAFFYVNTQPSNRTFGFIQPPEIRRSTWSMQTRMAASAATIMRRSTIGDIESVPKTFSSWNNCMSKAYCKYVHHLQPLFPSKILTHTRWPAIIGIIFASLLVLSILWCCARCLCCGMSCCCDCFKCCDLCGGRRKRAQNADPPPVFAPNQGYQPAPAPPAYEPPQFATFDTPSKNGQIHEDSLPAMPSWDTAASRRVEDHSPHEDMEMNNMDPRPGQTTGVVPSHRRTSRGGYSQVSEQPAPSTFGNYPSSYSGSGVGQRQSYRNDIADERLLGQQPGYGHAHAPYSGSNQYGQNGHYSGNPYSPQSPHGAGSPYSPARDNYDAFQPQLTSPLNGNAPWSGNFPPTQTSQSPFSPVESTRYAPTSVLTPAMPSPSHDRPPSPLQVGRRPVQGSSKEV
jgi:hypothetical protein